jgi:hypothetical protein
MLLFDSMLKELDGCLLALHSSLFNKQATEQRRELWLAFLASLVKSNLVSRIGRGWQLI